MPPPRLPKADRDILDLLASPQPPWDSQVQIVRTRIRHGRFYLLRRANKQGLLDPNIRLSRHCRLIHAAAEHSASFLRYLVLQCSVDPNTPAAPGVLSLHMAISDGQEDTALVLTEEAPGCDLNAREVGTRMSPLAMAAMQGSMRTLRALVRRGVNVDDPVAVKRAIWKGKGDAAVFHVEEAGSCTDWNFAELAILLGDAAGAGMSRLVKVLLRRLRGMKGDIKASEASAAWCAARNGHVAGLRALLEEGLDVKTAAVPAHEPDGSHFLSGRRLPSSGRSRWWPIWWSKGAFRWPLVTSRGGWRTTSRPSRTSRRC